MDSDILMQTTCPPEMLEPARVQILNESARLTSGDRAKEYGSPAINLACAGTLKQVARQHATRAISPGEWEAIDMVLTKISRVLTGNQIKRDTYVDGAAYFAIAGEIALLPDRG